jgi:multidrug efflux system outer membrane protein
VSARGAAVVAAVLAAAAGCAPPRTPPRAPATALPSTFSSAAATGTSLANQPWFDVFQDLQLRSLVGAAMNGNTDLRLAAARVLEARAAAGIARANELPSLSAAASAGAQRTPELGTTPARTAGAIGVQAAGSWELDFWGRLSQLTAAARADVLAAEWARRAVVTGLISDVASSYFRLRALDLELDIAQRTLASRQASLQLARVREQGGATSLIDVRQAEQLVYGATSTISELQRRIGLEEHALAVLLGQASISVTRGLALGDQPHAPDVPAGLPSDLLLNRPDLQRAEQVLEAASAEVESARAAFFPRIALTGAGGIASTALTSLVSGGAALWSLAASASQPLVDHGRRQSQFELTQARREEATIAYEATVREAFREVDDALLSYRQVREFRTQQELLEQSARDARRLADIRYQGGASSYLEVLDADTRLFLAELGSADARLQELMYYVALYRVLGGGWR